jgi:hypothetical protein
MAESLAVTNVGDGLMCLIIEPVGEEFWMPPGARFRVVGGEVDPDFEVNVMPGHLIVWLNAGSILDFRVVNEATGADVVCGDGQPPGYGTGESWI